MRAISLIALVVTAVVALAFASERHAQVAQSAVNDDEPSKMNALRQTVLSLRGIHTDCYDATIPVDARALLVTLKTKLEDLISEMLSAPATANLDAGELQSLINAELAKGGVLASPSNTLPVDENYADTGYYYGDVYEVTAAQPEGQADLLAITTTIGVCCGSDTSFYLYRRRGEGWSLVLAHAAREYEAVSGAHGRFQFGISRREAHTKPFVVVANVNPWCTSNWQSLRYAVLREGLDGHDPEILLETRSSIYLGQGEPSYSLRVGRNSFSLSFLDEKFMNLMNEGEEVDLDDTRAERFLKYRVSGMSVIKLIDR